MIRLKSIITEQSLPEYSVDNPVVGKLVKGDKNGKGVVEWKNAKYYGELRNGKMHGTGKLQLTNSSGEKSYYTGQFNSNLASGYGKQELPGGFSYKGNWKKGRIDGYGEYIWSDGTTFKGSWKAGELDGYGEGTFYDGSSYKGSWKVGLFAGYGVYTNPAGLKFCGNWIDERLDGNEVGVFDKMTSSPYRCNKKPVDFTYTDPENPITMSPTDPWEYYFNESEQQWYTRKKGTTDWIKMVAKLPDMQMQKALDTLNQYIDSHKKIKEPEIVKLKKGDKVKFNTSTRVGEILDLFNYKNGQFNSIGQYRVERNPNIIYLGQDTSGKYVLLQFNSAGDKPKYWLQKKFII